MLELPSDILLDIVQNWVDLGEALHYGNLDMAVCNSTLRPILLQLWKRCIYNSDCNQTNMPEKFIKWLIKRGIKITSLEVTPETIDSALIKQLDLKPINNVCFSRLDSSHRDKAARMLAQCGTLHQVMLYKCDRKFSVKLTTDMMAHLETIAATGGTLDLRGASCTTLRCIEINHCTFVGETVHALLTRLIQTNPKLESLSITGGSGDELVNELCASPAQLKEFSFFDYRISLNAVERLMARNEQSLRFAKVYTPGMKEGIHFSYEGVESEDTMLTISDTKATPEFCDAIGKLCNRVRWLSYNNVNPTNAAVQALSRNVTHSLRQLDVPRSKVDALVLNACLKAHPMLEKLYLPDVKAAKGKWNIVFKDVSLPHMKRIQKDTDFEAELTEAVQKACPSGPKCTNFNDCSDGTVTGEYVSECGSDSESESD